jgi:hypothetical protein
MMPDHVRNLSRYFAGDFKITKLNATRWDLEGNRDIHVGFSQHVLWYKRTNVLEKTAISFFHLKMEASVPSETLVTTDQKFRSQNPELYTIKRLMYF